MSWWSDGNRAWFTTGDGSRSARGRAVEGFLGLTERNSGSTISTLLHWKINPKVLSLGDAGFLQFFGLFRVIMANLNQNHK